MIFNLGLCPCKDKRMIGTLKKSLDTCISLDYSSLTADEQHVFRQLKCLPMIRTLRCSNSQLSYLPALPRCEELHCSRNQLTFLPDLLHCQILTCGNNKLMKLPELPHCKQLYCPDNYLFSLPNLPECVILSCFQNPLTSLPYLPKCLQIFYDITNATTVPSNPAMIINGKQVHLQRKFEYLHQTPNAITMPSGCCALDNQKVGEYLSQLRLIDKDLETSVWTLLTQTYYATYDDIIQKLNLAFDQFVRLIGVKPFVVITRDTMTVTTSESLMIYLLWKRLNSTQLNFKGIYSSENYVTKQYSKVWVDDAIYSGVTALHMSCSSYCEHMYIIAGYAPTTLTSEIIKEQIGINTTLCIGHRIKPFSDPLILCYFLANNRIPLYLDYKIACAYSTFYYIYDGAYLPTTNKPINPKGKEMTKFRYDGLSMNVVGGNELVKTYRKFGNLMFQKPQRDIIKRIRAFDV